MSDTLINVDTSQGRRDVTLTADERRQRYEQQKREQLAHLLSSTVSFEDCLALLAVFEESEDDDSTMGLTD